MSYDASGAMSTRSAFPDGIAGGVAGVTIAADKPMVVADEAAMVVVDRQLEQLP